MAPVKILHVIASIAPRYGGPSKAVVEMCRALGRQGQAVTLFTTDADVNGRMDVPTDGPLAANGFTLRYFPAGRWRRWGFSWPMALALRENIPEFDIVHIHSLYMFHTWASAHYCGKYGVPYMVRPHGTLDPFLRRKSRIKKAVYNFLIERRNLDRAAAIHYTVKEEMRLAHRAVGIRSPAVVVPLGIDLDEYAAPPPQGMLRLRYPETKGKLLVLFLGRINFVKGLDILARAFARAVRQRIRMHLLIAGPDDEGYGRRVRAWLAEEGVLNHVTFSGMLEGENKLAAFADSDLFVLPSYTESFGITVLEAMACGLPVLISDRVKIWREVVDAHAGIAVECSVEHLARGLLYLIDHPEDRVRMGENGKLLVAGQFTWNKVASDLISAYQLAIGHRLAPG